MELIKITNNSAGQDVVRARDLHSFLENTDNVNTWFERQSERAMLEEGEDFISLAFLQPSGQKSKDYVLTLSSAKEIAMLNGGEKGKQARKYFIECEKKLIAVQKYNLIETKIHKQIKLENKKYQRNNTEPNDKILLNFMKNERELAMIYKIELLQKDLKKLTEACASNGIYL